jgi:hypothetical protein
MTTVAPTPPERTDSDTTVGHDSATNFVLTWLFVAPSDLWILSPGDREFQAVTIRFFFTVHDARRQELRDRILLLPLPHPRHCGS